MSYQCFFLLSLPFFSLLLILLPNLLTTTTYLSLYTTNPSTWLTLNPTTTTTSTNLSLFIGILTLPDAYERRHFLRLVYASQPDPTAHIDIAFVFCCLSKPEQHLFLSLEIARFGDIVILNCTENMNSGKTYSFLSSLPFILPRKYDYVMKADDDTYIRLQSLSSALWNLPRDDLYYGLVIPCSSEDPFEHYMSGLGYVLSWDLVEWIAKSEIPPENKVGPEDKMVGEWFKKGKKARNRRSGKPEIYNFPGTDNNYCSHEFVPETVMVHKLKRWNQWRDVLRYFNATIGLVEPSNMYYIDESFLHF